MSIVEAINCWSCKDCFLHFCRQILKFNKMYEAVPRLINLKNQCITLKLNFYFKIIIQTKQKQRNRKIYIADI